MPATACSPPSAACSAANLRKSDVACRYGGEEFCVLMPETDAAGARRKIAALLKRWRVESLMQGAVGRCRHELFGRRGRFAVRGDQLAGLLKRADDELLTAKRAGRNRVLVAEADLTRAPDLPSSVKCSTTGGAAKNGPTMARHCANSGPWRKPTVWSSSVSQKIVST